MSVSPQTDLPVIIQDGISDFRASTWMPNFEILRNNLNIHTHTELNQIGLLPKFKTDQYYAPSASVISTLAMTINRLYAFPFLVGYQRDFTKMGIEITTGAALSTVRLGIWTPDSADDFRPKNLLTDVGSLNSAVIGTIEIDVAFTLTPGIYWLGAVAQGGAPALRSFSSDSYGYVVSNLLSSIATIQTAYTMEAISGAMPSIYAVGGVSSSAPRIMLKAA